jgi:diguanylate cyclase
MDLAAPPLLPLPAAHDPDAVLDRAFETADRGDARAGRALAEEALALARSLDDTVRIARALAIIANASRSLAEYERAASAALEGVALLQAAGLGYASAKVDLALVFFDLGDYPRALAHLFEARRDLEVAPDPAVDARCAHAEGLVQSRLDEFDLAQASFRHALALRRQARDGAGAATTLNSLGVVQLRLAQHPNASAAASRSAFEHALDYFMQARELALQHADARLVLLTDINMAGALGGLGCYAEALERFLALIDTARAIGDRHNESLILSNAGEAARRVGRLDQARALGEQALEVAQATGSKVREREARLDLSLTCEALEDYASALGHYKVHHALEREMRAAEGRRVTQAQALRSAVENAQREAARLRKENRLLERQARQDALTGLANRRAFDDALAASVTEARTLGRPLAVIAFDLDHFKSINDRYTHAAGDAVLREAAGVLRNFCRSSDLAARIGGEEFVLLLPGADLASACAIAERVRAEIAFRAFTPLPPGVRITLSAGVALDTMQGDAEELLRAADAALYRAKGEGRDRVCTAQGPAPSTH